MTTKHTPGPWQAGKYSSVVGCPISAQPDKTKNTVVLAGTMGVSGSDHRAESEANARLIAAAPDLLEALKALEPMWDKDHPLLTVYVKEIARARKALARAEGTES